MKPTSPVAVLGLVLASLLPAASATHAYGFPSPPMDWTFTNDGGNSPCATETAPPAYLFGGYGVGTEAPGSCNADNWSAHGEGYFRAPATGWVNFCAAGDDFVDVTINDDLILNDVGQGGDCASMPLREDRCYKLTVDFIELSGYANFAVSWDVSGSQTTMASEDFVQAPCSNSVAGDISTPVTQETSPAAEALPSTL